MIIGTTPTHTFNLPFEAALLKSVRVTYLQGEEVILKKETDECILTDTRVVVKLSQKDTLKFDYQRPVYVQLRALTTHGDALAILPKMVSAGQCLDGGELT